MVLPQPSIDCYSVETHTRANRGLRAYAHSRRQSLFGKLAVLVPPIVVFVGQMIQIAAELVGLVGEW